MQRSIDRVRSVDGKARNNSVTPSQLAQKHPQKKDPVRPASSNHVSSKRNKDKHIAAQSSAVASHDEASSPMKDMA